MVQELPSGIPTAQQLLDLPDYKFQSTVAERLAFTRRNQWWWRSLSHHTCIKRTDQALVHLRQALEAGIRRKEIPDENAVHQQRELINARQEQVRTLANLQAAVRKYKNRAAGYEDSIRKHQDACLDADIIPEQHDSDLWAVLGSDDD